MAQLDENEKVVKILINNDLRNKINDSSACTELAEVSKDLFKYRKAFWLTCPDSSYRVDTSFGLGFY